MQTNAVETPLAARPNVLEVQGLKTHFFTRNGVVKAVDGVDLTLVEGEILGLVGESGSGKSITGFSLMGLLDEPGRIVEGHLRLKTCAVRRRTGGVNFGVRRSR
jgi:peptide/nickel transport system ATP-binding protein